MFLFSLPKLIPNSTISHPPHTCCCQLSLLLAVSGQASLAPHNHIIYVAVSTTLSQSYLTHLYIYTFFFPNNAFPTTVSHSKHNPHNHSFSILMFFQTHHAHQQYLLLLYSQLKHYLQLNSLTLPSFTSTQQP